MNNSSTPFQYPVTPALRVVGSAGANWFIWLRVSKVSGLLAKGRVHSGQVASSLR